MNFNYKIVMQQYKPIECDNTVFLDRDGILLHTVERENGYRGSARCWDEVRLTPATLLLNVPQVQQSWNLVMVTNQPDIAKGLIDINFVLQVNDHIANSIPLNVALICPHKDEDNCDCRKPKTGLIDEFRKIYNLKGKEYMVGDTWRDRECAKQAGISFLLLEGL